MAGPYRDAMTTTPLGDEQILAVLADYFEYLQRHAPAEEMMAAVLTDDFETGFPKGMMWRGVDGLRDFLAARAGSFDERHQVRDVVEVSSPGPYAVDVKTRLEFFLRRREAPSPNSEEYTGSAFHTWRLRRAPDRWRVDAQLVDGFADLDDNSERLFGNPAEGLDT